MENLHLADEILDLIKTKYAEYQAGPSVKFDRSVFNINVGRAVWEETDVEIENIDTISAILRETRSGYKVLALNMANAQIPGGGFLSGAKAQEEDLFRCTNLSQTLTTDLYPMGRTEIIYSPKVHILRDAEYQDLEIPTEVGICSIAAHNNPHVNMYGMLASHIYDMTKCKIHMMFHIAHIQKYDCLVLGALGCGAFNNPPHEIARIFCEICAIYAQKFRRIVFAVKCGPDNPNCEIFKQEFLDVFNSETPDDLDTESDPGILYKDRQVESISSADDDADLDDIT